MRTLRGLFTAIVIVLISAAGARPAAGAPEGQMTWAWELGFIHAQGARVAESGLGLVPGWAFSAPYEDLKLRGK